MRHWRALREQREEQIFLVLTLVIGALVGLLVVAFIVITERFGARLYPAGGAAWRRLLVPVVGSLGMGYLLYRFFPDARGSGVPQTKAALWARGGIISPGTVFGKFFCTSATLACGIPLGREGPAVQVGAGIASLLGRYLGLRPEKVKALIPVGAAAAIAAAFNTPLGGSGVCVGRSGGRPARAGAGIGGAGFGNVVGNAATALGERSAFSRCRNISWCIQRSWRFMRCWECWADLFRRRSAGCCCRMRAWFLTRPRKTVWFQPVVGGLVTGVMACFVPQILGVGYKYVGDVLNGGMALKLMILLLVLKLFAVTISYASGNAGGIFGPSLFLGAMLGGIVGTVAHHFAPSSVASPGSLRAGGHGHGVCGDRARADDFGVDDFRDHPGLRGYRAADDFEPGELFYRFAISARADL